MKQLGFCAALAIALAAGSLQLATADDGPPVYVMSAAEVRELADYAAREIRAPKLAEVPVLMRAIDADLVKQFCSCRPRGLFIQGMLYVDPGVDLSTAIGKSIALHELAHAAQMNQRGPALDCIELNARELQAIKVQTQWLSENGSGFRPLFTSNCKP